MIKKGSDNVVADHLSCIPNVPSNSIPINEHFPDELLLGVSTDPWFADIINYLVTENIPTFWSKHDKNKFLHLVKSFYWDDPYLFKHCSDQVIRRCVPNNEFKSTLSFCHNLACGGHFGGRKTAEKFYNLVFIGLHFLKMHTNSIERVIVASN